MVNNIESIILEHQLDDTERRLDGREYIYPPQYKIAKSRLDVFVETAFS